MKLSTRMAKKVTLLITNDCVNKEIVLMVDCGENKSLPTMRTYSLSIADEYHRYLTKDKHCTLLTKESPVVNSRNQVIYHYTSTTYKDWCER